MWDGISSLNWRNLGRFIYSSVNNLTLNQNNCRILTPSDKMKILNLEHEWLQNLWDAIINEEMEYTKEENAWKIIKKFPRMFITSAYKWEGQCAESIWKEIFDTYEMLISFYDIDNERNYQWIIDFLEIICTKDALELMKKHLEHFGDLKFYNFLKIHTDSYKNSIFYPSNWNEDLYRSNSWFRILFDIVITKVGNPQDVTQREIQRVVKSIKEKFEPPAENLPKSQKSEIILLPDFEDIEDDLMHLNLDL